MDLRRLRAGEWVAAASGVVLIVSLFLPWYEGTFGVSFGRSRPEDPDFTAWEAFSVLDVVFALAGLLGIAVLVVTATQRTPALPVAVEALLTLVGLAVTALALYRLISIPDVAAFSPDGRYRGEFFPEQERRIGPWLALVGALGLTAGSLLAARDERLSRPGETTDTTGRPVPPPPEIEPLPPPGPAG